MGLALVDCVLVRRIVCQRRPVLANALLNKLDGLFRTECRQHEDGVAVPKMLCVTRDSAVKGVNHIFIISLSISVKNAYDLGKYRLMSFSDSGFTTVAENISAKASVPTLCVCQ